MESVRLRLEEQEKWRDDLSTMTDRERALSTVRASRIEEESGTLIGYYPEWDCHLKRERADWAAVLVHELHRVPTIGLDNLLRNYAEVDCRIAKVIRSMRASRPTRVRRLSEGAQIDLDACIRARIDRAAGVSDEFRVYESNERRYRDLSILLLLDISESTKDLIDDTMISVLSVERAAVALLSRAMSGMGDQFAVHAFCSNGREENRWYTVKSFNQRYDTAAYERLAGLRAGLSTRIGTALRHAGREILTVSSYRRLILLVTDGEPSDIDVFDGDYLVEDTRRAVLDLRQAGIDILCVALKARRHRDLIRMFGARNVAHVERIEMLPQKLATLYFRLAA
jgi:nitric oxide reductase activation protein